MTRAFLRYSPGIEADDPNFEQNLQTALEDMKQHMRASFKAEGIGRVVRDAHAKGYGLARGEVEILKGLPDGYAQGIYTSHMRPAHIHFAISAPGYHGCVTHLFRKGDAFIETDVVYGVKEPLIVDFVERPLVPLSTRAAVALPERSSPCTTAAETTKPSRGLESRKA